jgi:hypothetical protein
MTKAQESALWFYHGSNSKKKGEVNMKKRKKRNKKMRIGRYPFTIHADPLQESTAYPTHTHGLYDIGKPEFLMYPVAFGGKGNGQRINSAYKFFKKQKNAVKLKAILNGKTIKLTGPQLYPKYMKNDPYVYCFREVPPEFEAVKLAYPGDVASECPGIRFIQIWVDGDYFALMDDYYRGGVEW